MISMTVKGKRYWYYWSLQECSRASSWRLSRQWASSGSMSTKSFEAVRLMGQHNVCVKVMAYFFLQSNKIYHRGFGLVWFQERLLLRKDVSWQMEVKCGFFLCCFCAAWMEGPRRQGPPLRHYARRSREATWLCTVCFPGLAWTR